MHPEVDVLEQSGVAAAAALLLGVADAELLAHAPRAVRVPEGDALVAGEGLGAGSCALVCFNYGGNPSDHVTSPWKPVTREVASCDQLLPAGRSCTCAAAVTPPRARSARSAASPTKKERRSPPASCARSRAREISAGY